MTETTATRLAAAIVDARKWVFARYLPHDDDCERKRGEPCRCERRHQITALTRLEKLCVASGRIEQHDCDSVISYRTCASHCELAAEIEALLREET